MELYKVASIMLIGFICQVTASPVEENTSIQENSRILNHALTDASQSLKSLYHEAKVTLEKFQTCKPATHLDMYSLAAVKLSDFKSCINATREIADFEVFGLHGYDYIKLIVYTVIDVAKAVFNCHQESGVFNVLNCTLVEIQKSGPQINEILNEAQNLIGELKIDTYNMIYYFKKCVGLTTSEFLIEAHNLLETNC